MAILTVGSGLEYSTLSAAVTASRNGDTIEVQAGVYTNDFPAAISTAISIVGVGGMAHFVATQAPPNGKAILVTRSDVTIDHLEFSGVAVSDGNGAAIRFEGGNLTIMNSYFHDNQDGILSGEVAGSITIDHSEFSHNGTGDGQTHNIYIGHISNLTVTDSYIHDAVVGHEVKSRADTTVLSNNRIVDGGGSASYSIDLPNGGNARIQNNIIEQGPNSDNHTIVAYAEETSTPWAGSQLIVDGNTILNDQPGNPLAVWNTTGGVTAQITGNHFYGLAASQIASGPNAQSGNDFLTTEPSIDRSHPWDSGTASPMTPIESIGATTLAQSGNQFYLLDSTSGVGPLLTFNGIDSLADRWAGWVPIGAEKIASGYEVAWKGPGALYEVWNTDNSGAFISQPIGDVLGSNPALQAAETSFQQDLNGDGHIGSGTTTTPIESIGATTLAQSGNQFYLLDSSSGSGPTLTYHGSDALADRWAGWAPIGAEKIASGYEVAWKGPGALYEVWNTDNSGAFISQPIGDVPGSNPALQAAETSFQQDLNDDGHIGTGTTTTPIESIGATTLAQSGNQFYLLDSSSGSGPTLTYHGSDALADRWAGWAPIGAEKTASGYEVAWKGPGALYEVWNTDNSGSFISQPIGDVPGSNPALQAAETSFQQDLNGDGHIGTLGGQMAAANLPAPSGNILQNDAHHDWLL